MVSSYNIFTNISIPIEYRKLFNKFSINFRPYLLSESVKTKSYYDSGYYPGGIETLGKWLNNEISLPEEPLKNYSNNWEANEKTGVLFDNCEKFHGSVRVLHYMIDNFFNIYNIKLNGIIIGINTEYNHLFIYNVVDNVITLNEPLTRKFTIEYEELLFDNCSDYDDDSKSDKMMYNILKFLQL
jgi:hypothetical protein